jgi:hypothetical protein
LRKSVKLRLSRAGLRLRLDGADLSALAHGGTVTEPTPFPNGVFECSLKAVADGIGACLTDSGVAVTIPTALLGDLDAGNGLKAELQTPGEVLHVLIEKDRRPERR